MPKKIQRESDPDMAYLNVRIPKELKDLVAVEAAKNHRNISGQVLHYLERGVNDDRDRTRFNYD